jgi:hypothetical protein
MTLLFQRSPDSAGRSAGEIFQAKAKSSRRRIRFLYWISGALVVASLVGERLVSGSYKYVLGLLGGAALSFGVFAWDSPPWRIENWRYGSEGERLTGKELEALRSEGWFVRHDTVGRGKRNIDHIVVGDAGVFLLDSKNYGGEGMIEGTRLQVRHDKGDDVGWTHRDPGAGARAAAFTLHQAILHDTGIRIWVQPVLVLWMRFPQQEAECRGVPIVHGGTVLQWLRERPASAQTFDKFRVASFIERLPAAHPPRPPRDSLTA